MSDVAGLVKWLDKRLRPKLRHPVTFLLGVALGSAIGVYASYAWVKDAAEEKVEERISILETHNKYLRDKLEACQRGLGATLPVVPVAPPEGEQATGRPVEAAPPAEDDGNTAETLTAIEEGERLFEDGHHGEALQRYMKAYRLLPGTVREQLDGQALKEAMELLDTDLSEPSNVRRATMRFEQLLGEQRIIRLLRGMVKQ
jgi:hypothetical protein